MNAERHTDHRHTTQHVLTGGAGIFRLQGNEEEMNVVKDQLNRGVFSSCKDVNAIACLIKQWFRDMPQSIFVDIPAAVLLNMSAEPMEHEVQEALGHIKEPNASLFAWLTDLLADVAAMESVNKMSPRACGTPPTLHLC